MLPLFLDFLKFDMQPHLIDTNVLSNTLIGASRSLLVGFRMVTDVAVL
jgi:hypothetical protein